MQSNGGLMDRTKFEEIFSKMIDEEKNCMFTKGSDYCRSDDRLANFKRVGEQSGIGPKRVWLVYFLKHMDAIINYIVNNKNESEPIQSRIMDCRNYLAILRCIIEEEETIK